MLVGQDLAPLAQRGKHLGHLVARDRADVDALTFGRVENPSFIRYDLFARYELGSFGPYSRVENVTDKRYEEVNGYPAPRRRFAAGLEARF